MFLLFLADPSHSFFVSWRIGVPTRFSALETYVCEYITDGVEGPEGRLHLYTFTREGPPGRAGASASGSGGPGGPAAPSSLVNSGFSAGDRAVLSLEG